MKKAVIFDLDGTLVDTDLMIVLTIKKLFEKYRPDYKPSIRELLSFSGPPLAEVVPQFFPNEDPKEVIAYFVSLTPKAYEENVIIMDGALPILKTLKEKGYKLAVCTSKYRPECNMTYKLVGLEGVFDYTICGDEVKNSKPDPESLNLCLKTMGIAKEEAIYVGDTKYDALAAKNADIDFVLCDNGPRHFPKDIHVDKRISSWDEFMEVSGL